ncbi:hypothetical protein DCAR_0209383 [Daucus carota subsp. sativus]|uniref:DC1 domain-containing protein n=1 Tax=Daucus carota subsp. sativus TaxID=79200 RepID=A0AAF0WHS2_DAUCS|nr:hypothetical protein DCAR_0209383 [Daucus carota subsp. sativus]
MEHISHPEHLLELKEYDVIGENAMCYVCDKTVIGTPTYTCTSKSVGCQSFYLHKSCAELPPKINHNEHNQHPLTYQQCHTNHLCDICYFGIKFAYSCLEANCDFNVCVSCASEERVFLHEGHKGHTLTLLQRVALFVCDACGEEAKDFSYICNICQFWIHKKCALSPFHISVLNYHHHPLTLIYSIPFMHRYFERFCAICDKELHVNMWMYYCHKCTYFVHMKCAASSDTEFINEIKSEDIHIEAELVQFPLRGEESVFEFILTQCGKLQVEVQGKGKNNITISTTPSDPHVIEEHWSHKIHPLELLQFAVSENDDVDDRQMLICDGCIQPITVSHPYYYACKQCSFFLHSFCATKLPMELPAGASPSHPQHLLSLQKRDIFYELVGCEVCPYFTNGFYYECETCDIKVEIRCAFAPSRINHTSHRHYSLVQRPFSGSRCKICRLRIFTGVEYACETCDKFHIHWHCALYPSQMKHKYDSHSVTLRYPPFFYEGVFYCEVCEEQVNNQLMLYHCDACDHSFHFNCLCSRQSIKLGGTIDLKIDNRSHTLAFVLKKTTGKKSPDYVCRSCRVCHYYYRFFECVGCGYLLCRDCVTEKLKK